MADAPVFKDEHGSDGPKDYHTTAMREIGRLRWVSGWVFFSFFFRCAVASLYEVVSVRPSVRPSVSPSRVIFEGEKYTY